MLIKNDFLTLSKKQVVDLLFKSKAENKIDKIKIKNLEEKIEETIKILFLTSFSVNVEERFAVFCAIITLSKLVYNGFCPKMGEIFCEYSFMESWNNYQNELMNFQTLQIQDENKKMGG